MDETRNSERSFDESPDEPVDPTLTSVVRELGAVARARREPHPDPEDLIDYSQGEMGAAAARRIRAHLESCPDCARAVLDLGELARFEAASEDPSPEEIATRLRGFEQQATRRAVALPKVEGRAEPRVVRARPAPRRWMVPATWAAAPLAALLLLLVFSRETAAPRPNVHVASLAPAAQSLTRDADSFAPLRVPAKAEHFVLILNLADQRQFSRYLLEVWRATESGEVGKSLWSSGDLRRGETGNFTVEFERSFLPQGRHLLRLSGVGEGETTILASYALELVYD